MNFTVENGVLTIKLIGRIDTSNAQDIGAQIQQILADNEHTSLILDADELEYISSAGLRVVLSIKKTEKEAKIVNVSSEVYEIFEMTGFTEILDIVKAYRKLSVDGCKVIGKGAKGTVYRYDEDIIVKVYNDFVDLESIKKERELAKSAFVLGIPTAIPYDIVKVDDKFGSVFELLDAKSYSQLIDSDPDNFEKYVGEFVGLLKIIHSTEVVKDGIPSIEVWVEKWKKRAYPLMDETTKGKLDELLAGIEKRKTMIHGDYHTNNVMSFNNETLLIDMDTLAYGNPVFELANIFMTMVGFGEKDVSLIENFLGIPYETAKKIWNKFIVLYMGTEDSSEIEKVENKAKLICYLHLMSHFIHHGTPNPDDTDEMIKYYQDKVVALLEVVDNLNL